MYRKCTTEISTQHQRQIEASLLELMGSIPFEKITVTQICQVAGISRRIFYHLFSSKTDVLHALIDHVLLDSESYRPELPDQLLRFFLYWREQEKLMDALRDNGMTNLLLERMITFILNEDYDIRHWLRKHTANSGMDILIFNLCGIMGITYNWYLTGYAKSPQEMAATAAPLIASPPEGNHAE